MCIFHDFWKLFTVWLFWLSSPTFLTSLYGYTIWLCDLLRIPPSHMFQSWGGGKLDFVFCPSELDLSLPLVNSQYWRTAFSQSALANWICPLDISHLNLSSQHYRTGFVLLTLSNSQLDSQCSLLAMVVFRKIQPKTSLNYELKINNITNKCYREFPCSKIVQKSWSPLRNLVIEDRRIWQPLDNTCTNKESTNVMGTNFHLEE